MNNLFSFTKCTIQRFRKFGLPLALSMLGATAYADPQWDIYVDSVNGNDSNLGTYAAPLKTIPQAQNKVRSINATATQDINVYIKGGMHQLDSTLTFTNLDSGNNGHSIIYQPYGEGKAVISGGTALSGWQATGVNGIYFADTTAGDTFRQLYSGDIPKQRPQRVRFPKEGKYEYVRWFNLNSSTSPGIELQPDTAFYQWPTSAFAGMEMVIEKSFSQSRLHVAGVSNPTPQNGLQGPFITLTAESNACELQLSPNSTNGSPEALGGKNYGVYFENSLNFLTTTGVKGEWYANHSTGRVYYIPRDVDGAPANLTLYRPRLEQLLDIKDNAHNIVFYGLEFRHTGWNAPSNAAYVGTQASHYRAGCPLASPIDRSIPSGITIENAHDIAFYSNLIAQFGGSGIAIRTGTQTITVQGNYFSDISASGIRIETDNWLPTTANLSRDNLIADNYLIGIGKDFDGVGIFATFTKNTHILRNKLQFVSYSGISFGWGWLEDWNDASYPELTGNTISNNEISDVMLLHRDGAGIYTLPVGIDVAHPERSLLISSNRIHDFYGSLALDGFRPAGIYLDHRTGHVSVASNQLSTLNVGFFLQNYTSGTTDLRAHDNTIATNYINNVQTPFPNLSEPALVIPAVANNQIYSNVIDGVVPTLSSGPQAVFKSAWSSKLGYANLGIFRVGTSTFFNYGTTYCGFATSQSFFNAWGANDTRNVPAYDGQPVLETYLGFCPP
jgi:hypothetical protein